MSKGVLVERETRPQEQGVALIWLNPNTLRAISPLEIPLTGGMRTMDVSLRELAETVFPVLGAAAHHIEQYGSLRPLRADSLERLTLTTVHQLRQNPEVFNIGG